MPINKMKPLPINHCDSCPQRKRKACETRQTPCATVERWINQDEIDNTATINRQGKRLKIKFIVYETELKGPKSRDE